MSDFHVCRTSPEWQVKKRMLNKRKCGSKHPDHQAIRMAFAELEALQI